MNSAGKFRITLSFFIFMAWIHICRSQVREYQFSTNVNGSLILTMTDLSSGGAYYQDPHYGATSSFTNLGETVYLYGTNTMNHQVDQVGTISGFQSSTFSINGSQTIGGQTVTGTLTVTQQPIGSLTFDTSEYIFGYDSSSMLYRSQGSPLVVGEIPVEGSYSLVTGGQTYTGTFNYTLRTGGYDGAPTTFSTFSLSADNSSLTLGVGSGLPANGVCTPAAENGNPEVVVVNFTAANGYKVDLAAGEGDYGWQDDFGWGVASPQTATTVPLISSVSVSGSNVSLTMTHGVPGGTFYVLSATNLSLPLAQWSVLATNSYSTNGTFTNVLAINPQESQRYYRIK